MKTVDFPESNGGLGAPRDWDEAKQGTCGYLNTHHDGQSWTSCWKPTAEDLKVLNAGGCIYLGVATGDRPQPPVSMYAGHRMWTEGGKDYRLPDEDPVKKALADEFDEPVEYRQGPLFLKEDGSLMDDDLDLSPSFLPLPRRVWLVLVCLAGAAILTGALIAFVEAVT